MNIDGHVHICRLVERVHGDMLIQDIDEFHDLSEREASFVRVFTGAPEKEDLSELIDKALADAGTDPMLIGYVRGLLTCYFGSITAAETIQATVNALDQVTSLED